MHKSTSTRSCACTSPQAQEWQGDESRSVTYRVGIRAQPFVQFLNGDLVFIHLQLLLEVFQVLLPLLLLRLLLLCSRSDRIAVALLAGTTLKNTQNTHHIMYALWRKTTQTDMYFEEKPPKLTCTLKKNHPNWQICILKKNHPNWRSGDVLSCRTHSLVMLTDWNHVKPWMTFSSTLGPCDWHCVTLWVPPVIYNKAWFCLVICKCTLFVHLFNAH